MTIYEDEVRAAGFDEDQLKRIASISRRISKAAKEASGMGIEIFGGTGNGTLRYNDKKGEESGATSSSGLILSELDGCFDGGCGATMWDNYGLLRGE